MVSTEVLIPETVDDKESQNLDFIEGGEGSGRNQQPIHKDNKSKLKDEDSRVSYIEVNPHRLGYILTIPHSPADKFSFRQEQISIGVLLNKSIL